MYTEKKFSLLILGACMLTGVQEASAWQYMTDDIFEYCKSKGYSMISGYDSESASCTTCHANKRTDGGEYNAGNYEYFCPASSTQTQCTDADRDGFYAEGDSCGTLADFDDNNRSAYPGAPENCTDGIDNDGDGLVDSADSDAVNCDGACTDMDSDGYSTEGGSCGAIDCNDNNDAINPGAVESCSDGIDNNCNGLTDTADTNAVNCSLDCTDTDGDGYSSNGGSCGAVDCDDNNARVNPGARENCDDGVDNNCNNRVDSADSVCESSQTADDTCAWWKKSKDCDVNDSTEDEQSQKDSRDRDEGRRPGKSRR